MSEDSLITVDQPPPRNDNHPRQIGMGRGQVRQVIPLANMRPPSTPTARRILVIQNQTDIVSILSSLSRTSHQTIYILSGRGYVSQAALLSLPYREPLICIGRGNILYLSGWFRPTITPGAVSVIPSSRPNGILHVSLSGVDQSVAIANTLVASGPIEVEVIFICGPGSVFPPDAPGVPREPIRVLINENSKYSCVDQSVAIANTLVASGPIEVEVIFICGPGSVFPPDAPGVPREPIRVLINAIPAQQAPVAE